MAAFASYFWSAAERGGERVSEMTIMGNLTENSHIQIHADPQPPERRNLL